MAIEQTTSAEIKIIFILCSNIYILFFRLPAIDLRGTKIFYDGSISKIIRPQKEITTGCFKLNQIAEEPTHQMTTGKIYL